MKKNNAFKRIFLSQRVIALSTLFILFVLFSIFGKNFLTTNSMISLLESTYYIICLAFGMTFIISTGGIDLSMGSVAMCGALIGGVAYSVWGMPIGMSLVITIVVCVCFGILNGVLVSIFKIPPFVATMGSSYIAQGLGYIVSKVQTMRYPVITSPDGWFKRVFYKTLNGFPIGVVYMVLLFAIAYFIFRYTKIGKYACAIGSNSEATRLSGVKTRKWTMLVYTIAGVFAGMGGIFYSATYTSVLPGSGSGMEMNAIAAVVIGGTSLSGGSGTMVGTIIGVFIMAVLRNGLQTIGIQQQWQVMFTGLAVLLAVMLDTYRGIKEKHS
ncbi:ABC transporter permease [Lachnospiraceae bacterium OttesenSCG-928-J05]|nr:ABC transporter permease [Lachnospiraceae bacterium OttesenSCG-928-J05]